jgi:hypothetical protein
VPQRGATFTRFTASFCSFLSCGYGSGTVCLALLRASLSSQSLRRKFYDLLEVPEDASEADLKKAYRKK